MFLVHGEFNWVIAGAWMGLLLLLWLLYRSDRCTQFWGLWFLVFLMPVLQLVPNPVWVADRYLYVPVVAACVLGSRLIFWIAGRLTAPWQKVGWAVAMSAIAVVFTWHTWNHLPIWRNELALWGATTPGCMQAASCHVSLGQALLANGQPQRGGDELVLAVQLTPAPLYLSYLGDALTLSARNYPEAIVMYRRALDGANASGGSVSNSLASDFYAKLARAQIFAGSLDEASRAIEVGKQLDITNPRLWVVEAFLQWKRKNWEGARYSLRTVMEMTGHSSQAANLVGYYWGDAREIGRLLADLHATSAASSLAHPIR
jgi:tetratricopeptide (TPR) repeat protein